MPFEISFTKHMEIAQSEHYINDCCVGGDVVLSALMPVLRSHYGPLAAVQEDWGWFIWFTNDGRELAIDVVCDDPRRGAFRMHLTSRIRRFMRRDKVDDTPELELLSERVMASLGAWLGHAPALSHLSEQYAPLAI
jgi:hypothetical protein